MILLPLTGSGSCCMGSNSHRCCAVGMRGSAALCIRQSLSFPRWKGPARRSLWQWVWRGLLRHSGQRGLVHTGPPIPKARCPVVLSAQAWGQPHGTGQEDGCSDHCPPRGPLLPQSHTPGPFAWAELRTGRNRTDYLSDIPGSLVWGWICGWRRELPCSAPFGLGWCGGYRWDSTS